ncbi:MAG: formyltransferase family protein [Gammaproteobacteria bacterium]|nr:formyltransferase family protein [Gammaproteobacteria bacterium]
MKIFYIGSSGALSLMPFKKLLSSGHMIVAVGVFNPVVFDAKIIAIENASLALLASQSGIPVIDLSQPVDDVVQQCSEFTVDVTFMSCYGSRLPEAIINLAGMGCYNLHPSLLPGFRGPEPVFWQMRQGAEMGVSWHRVVRDFDAGDIVASKRVFLDDGEQYLSITALLAEAGANLLPVLLAELSSGSVTQTPQQQGETSYYSCPEKSDFIIDTQQSAQQLFNFMSATQIFGQPYLCDTGQYRYTLEKALDYDNNARLETVEVQADRLYIPCNEGVLIASYTDKIRL